VLRNPDETLALVYEILLREQCQQSMHWRTETHVLFTLLLIILPIFSATRFSKVPQLSGGISGNIIFFVSSKRRRLEARNFAVILICVPFITCKKKTSFTEKAVRSFTNGFLGPKSFRDFRETGHCLSKFQKPFGSILRGHNSHYVFATPSF